MKYSTVTSLESGLLSSFSWSIILSRPHAQRTGNFTNLLYSDFGILAFMPDLSHLYPIQIVDIYSDNRWNATEEKAKGTRGVIFKGGQGGYFSLPRQYVADAIREGLPYGIYWIPDSRYDSGYHMRAIMAGFPDKNFGQLPWFWDCEKPRVTMTDADYWKTPFAGSGLIEAVIDKFTAWSGKPSGIYTAMGFAQLLGWDTLSFKTKSLYGKLAKMPLWAAQYNNFILEPTLFGPWKSWMLGLMNRGRSWSLWQYRPDPDYNYFNGDEAAFQAFMGGYTPPTSNSISVQASFDGKTINYKEQ